MPQNDPTDDAYYPIRRSTNDPRRSTEMPKEKKDKTMKAKPYAELFRDEEQGFRYRIKGANHEIMVTSESYTRIDDASAGLFALTKIAVKFDKWYEKGDDSWLRDLTEETVDQAAVRVLGSLPAHERASESDYGPDGFGN